MTTVTVAKKGTKYIFSAEGHSGYGPAGQDIVCAGVSALCFALAVSVRPYQFETSEGNMYICFDKKNKRELNMAVNGLHKIEKKYPNHLIVFKKSS